MAPSDYKQAWIFDNPERLGPFRQAFPNVTHPNRRWQLPYAGPPPSRKKSSFLLSSLAYRMIESIHTCRRGRFDIVSTPRRRRLELERLNIRMNDFADVHRQVK